MTETITSATERVAPSARIANLDVLRGIAILAILLMNIPYMGGYAIVEPFDPRLVSWTPADQATYRFVSTFLDGTQRGLLELLFGAGIMIMVRGAMAPDGPVAVADLHYRRNLLLVGLGLFQALVLCWPGDILFPYGLVSIFVFPFRTLGPKWKALIGVGFILLALAPGVQRYVERSNLQAAATAAEAKVAREAPLTATEQQKLDTWRETVIRHALPAQSAEKRAMMAQEKKMRLGAFPEYWAFAFAGWLKLNFAPTAWFWMAEIFGTMMLGAALFQWGVLQGRQAWPVYAGLAVVGYGLGATIRTQGVNEAMAFNAAPRIGWITWDLGRIALTLGHVGLINLVLKSALAARLLSPFQATGKMPLTTYMGASAVGMLILFPGFGFRLFGRYGWAGLETIALAVMAAQLAFANVWLLFFQAGPVEWVWKSLAYRKAQPFRKPAGAAAFAAAE